ncbi:PRC-barrel domain-containing protein [Pedobacter sp. GR22-10]|uniref:PRC-barrel domain-containing protein n=1 Tax=Pedobacter sp. GR22-10 TaxID=2994472 RepID=UPI0022476265|nr:PRC-barrel domain-containing protein [Pedobacter sp. GR22-10]MCX2430198.1 PRC-barrel domain-containing protein [Pedobacter sp. GR22-10]
MNSGIIEYVNLEELSKGDYKLIDGETDITGWSVKDGNDRQVGKVRDMLFDPVQNAIRYIIIDLDQSISGDDEKAILIPIGYANLTNNKKEVILPEMVESQFIAMPRYIIGEVTRDTEMQIRSAIAGSPVLDMEEEPVETVHAEFYRHHHFDRGNVTAMPNATENTTMNELFTQPTAEAETIPEITDTIETTNISEVDNEIHSATTLQEFSIDTQDGTFGIEPQENGTYRIFDKEKKIGLIYAEPGEQGLRWRTMDQLGDRFVTMIGEAIRVHNDSQGNL